MNSILAVAPRVAAPFCFPGWRAVQNPNQQLPQLQIVYTLLTMANWEHIHSIWLSFVCKSQICASWLFCPSSPQHLAVCARPSSKPLKPSIENTFQSNHEYLGTTGESRARGSLAVFVLVQNQTQISDSGRRVRAGKRHLMHLEWNIHTSGKFRVL